MDGNDVEEWLEGMLAKVEGMWSDLRQAETVNYVECRVQTIGTDVKSFCSEFIQEVFSSSPAQTQTTAVTVDDVPTVEITGNKFEESISVQDETRDSVDEPDVIVPASLDYSSCQSTLAENFGDDDSNLHCCQPETSTCDFENEKIFTSFSERGFENKECINASNNLCPGDCENDESLEILRELPITIIPDATSFSELVDVSPGNSVLSEWDYTMWSGNSEEVIEHETMLGESCIVVYSNNSCPGKHQLTKHRANTRKLQRKPCLRADKMKDRDSIPEPKADESSSGGGHSVQQPEILPLAPEFKLIEQGWEIV